VLGPGHPCGDDAALLVRELFGNSVRHSQSGATGGTVTVAGAWRRPYQLDHRRGLCA
jgi:anti-sigma regulatory factor (Ser/Thr protein kinase)